MKRLAPSPCPEAIEPVNFARRFAKPTLLTALAALAVTMVMAMALMGPTRSARAAAPSGQEIAEGLTCQCGCGLTVANCNHPNCSFSVPMRQRIDTMLAHGMGARRNHRLLPQAVWREDSLRADHAGFQPARLDDAVRGADSQAAVWWS